MKILLKHVGENSVVLIEATYMKYEEDLFNTENSPNGIYIIDSEGDSHGVYPLTEFVADTIIKQVFREGKIDLSTFESDLIQDEDEE